MNEMPFESLNALFDHVRSRGGATRQRHGALGMFYEQMKAYLDPNTCSCKKGKGALQGILKTVGTLPSMQGEALVNSKSLFDNRIVRLSHDGKPLATF